MSVNTPEPIAPLIAAILHQDEPNNIKVEIAKEEISNGNYRINASHIATKLLEFANIAEAVLET